MVGDLSVHIWWRTFKYSSEISLSFLKMSHISLRQILLPRLRKKKYTSACSVKNSACRIQRLQKLNRTSSNSMHASTSKGRCRKDNSPKSSSSGQTQCQQQRKCEGMDGAGHNNSHHPRKNRWTI